MKDKKFFQSKSFYKLITVTLLTSLLFVFNQCVVEQTEQQGNVVYIPIDNPAESDNDDNDDSNTTGSAEFVDEGATEVARTSTSVGIKDFEQTYKTYEALTGITLEDENDVRNTYNDMNSQLANENDLKKYGTSTLIANLKLAGIFCHRMMSEAQYYNLIGFADMNTRADEALDTQGRLDLITKMMDRFWGQGTQSNADWDANVEDLNLLIGDILEGENMGSSNTTKKVAKGLCVAILVSPKSVLL